MSMSHRMRVCLPQIPDQDTSIGLGAAGHTQIFLPLWHCLAFAGKEWVKRHGAWSLGNNIWKNEATARNKEADIWIWDPWAQHQSIWQCPTQEHSGWGQETLLSGAASPPMGWKGPATTTMQLLPVWFTS